MINKSFKTPYDILSAAADKIKSKNNWTQGSWARDKDGVPVHSENPSATKFCAIGALKSCRTYYNAEAYVEADKALHNAAVEFLSVRKRHEHFPIVVINDAFGHQDVIYIYNMALARYATPWILIKKFIMVLFKGI